MTMKTLDEMWETKTQEQYDVTMDDMEVKIVNELTNHNARHTEKDNQPANDDIECHVPWQCFLVED